VASIGLGFYARIPVLACVYDAYEVAATELEQRHAINWLTIFVPRLSLGLILAFMVYGLFRAAGSVLVRLHRVAISAQPTWRFIKSNPSVRQDMDIARTWRSTRSDPTVAPHAGVHLPAAGEEITISISQECQIALPAENLVPEVSVTVTSNRPGVDAQVTIAANLNSPGGSYLGPTKRVGQGQFTSTSSQVHAGFVALPSGWPVLGVGAEAIWADGARHSVTLNYVQLACDHLGMVAMGGACSQHSEAPFS